MTPDERGAVLGLLVGIAIMGAIGYVIVTTPQYPGAVVIPANATTFTSSSWSCYTQALNNVTVEGTTIGVTECWTP